MPVFLYWLFGSGAAAAIVLHFWPYDHSTGSLMFYGIVVGGTVVGLVHRAAVRRRENAEKPRGQATNDV